MSTIKLNKALFHITHILKMFYLSLNSQKAVFHLILMTHLYHIIDNLLKQHLHITIFSQQRMVAKPFRLDFPLAAAQIAFQVPSELWNQLCLVLRILPGIFYIMKT